MRLLSHTKAEHPLRYSATARRLAPLWAILGVVGLGLLSACSHYYLGRATPPPFNSLAIAPVANACFAPQVQAALSDQLARAFVSDGTVKVASQDHADATLEVTLIQFSQAMSATREGDTALARSYDLTLVALCTLVNNQTQETLIDRAEVTSTLNLQVDSNFIDIQYQALPALARTLAQKIRDKVLNSW